MELPVKPRKYLIHIGDGAVKTSSFSVVDRHIDDGKHGVPMNRDFTFKLPHDIGTLTIHISETVYSDMRRIAEMERQRQREAEMRRQAWRDELRRKGIRPARPRPRRRTPRRRAVSRTVGGPKALGGLLGKAIKKEEKTDEANSDTPK